MCQGDERNYFFHSIKVGNWIRVRGQVCQFFGVILVVGKEDIQDFVNFCEFM